MDTFLQEIESGTAYIPIFIKEDYQTTLDHSHLSGGNVINIYLPALPGTSTNAAPRKKQTTLIYIDGVLSELRPDSPPNLHPLPENAAILTAI